MPKLKNARVWWAKVQSPDKKYHCWSVDIVVDKKQAVEFKKAAEEFYASLPDAKGKGRLPKVTLDEDVMNGYVIKARRNIKKANGADNPPPKVVDAANEPFDKLIGNDSVADVMYKFYPWNNAFGKGVGVDLVGLQVLELVPYEGKGGDTEEEEEEDFKPVGTLKIKNAPSTDSEDLDDLLD